VRGQSLRRAATLIAILALVAACARRAEVVATEPAPIAPGPPPIAAGPPARGPGGEPSVSSEARGAAPSAALAPGAQAPAAREGAGAEGLTGPGGQEGEVSRPGAAGLPSAAPLPPGTEVIAPPPAPPREAPAAQVAQLRGTESPLKDVFFDFDKAEIRPDGRAALDENLRWLKAHARATMTIEGHCDERGSSEYNLGLGERRAKVTRDYLVASGIDSKRIATVSYGKERPFVLGHDESAWKWNRRAHFVVMKD
jgi:peptidoglycan-associated lipoprotein